MSDTNEVLSHRYVWFYGGTITFGQIVKTPTQGVHYPADRAAPVARFVAKRE